MFFLKKKSFEPKKRKSQNPKVYLTVQKKIEKGKTGKSFRFLRVLITFVFFLTLGYLALFSPFLEITTVSVRGVELNREIEISRKVNELLSGKYANLIKKNNFLFVRPKLIEEELLKNFNRLSKAEAKKIFPNLILVSAVERKADLVLCSSGICYLVDENGVAYSRADISDEELRERNFLTLVDESASLVEIGKTKIDKDFIEFAKKMSLILKDNLNFNWEGGFYTPALVSGEIFVRITENGWILKLSQQTPPEEIYKMLVALIDQEIKRENLSNLEYLDLRIKGKAYYKMKPNENDSAKFQLYGKSL